VNGEKTLEKQAALSWEKEQQPGKFQGHGTKARGV